MHGLASRCSLDDMTPTTEFPILDVTVACRPLRGLSGQREHVTRAGLGSSCTPDGYARRTGMASWPGCGRIRRNPGTQKNMLTIFQGGQIARSPGFGMVACRNASTGRATRCVIFQMIRVAKCLSPVVGAGRLVEERDLGPVQQPGPLAQRSGTPSSPISPHRSNRTASRARLSKAIAYRQLWYREA